MREDNLGNNYFSLIHVIALSFSKQENIIIQITIKM